MVDFAGWDMPVQYETGILQEHLATRKFGGLFDISHMGRLRITGERRIAFMQHILSNNVEALGPWQSHYTLIPNDTGGLIDDGYLYRWGKDDYLIVVNASNRERVWNHFQEEVGNFDGVEIDDLTAESSTIAFQGPLTGRILAGLLEAGRLPEPSHGSLSEVTLCGVPARVARTGYTGEPIGFELFAPSNRVEEIWAKLYAAGRDCGIVPVGLGARDTLRLEAAMPLYGHEFGTGPDGKEIPAFGFPLARVAVSFAKRKGDYVGRNQLLKQFEHVQKLRTGTYAPSDLLLRRVRPLAISDKGIARRGNEVFIAKKAVGAITSGTVTPYWNFEGSGATMRITDYSSRRAIALAYLDAMLQPGQEVEVLVRGRRLRARIVRWHGRSEAPPYFRPIPATRVEPESAEERGREAVRRVCGLKKALGEAGLLLKKGLENHEWRQKRCINLIPSEMTPSPLVRLLQISDPVGRYAEHKKLLAAYEQEVFYYQGTDFVAWVEERVAEEMAAFLGCPLVEARSISGQMANMTVFSAFVDYKNRTDRRNESERIRLAMNNHLGKGGHLSAQPMGAFRDYVAKDPVTEKYAVVNFPVCSDNPYMIDIEKTAELLDHLDPEILIFGKSMVLHPEPVAEIHGLVKDKKGPPTIMYDMAHVLGLVGPHFQEPFREGADVVTGSTHKTFFGTQRGIIGGAFKENTPEFDLWKAIRRRAFPGMVSNHHLGTLLGLLMAAIEMRAFKEDYQPQVIANAKAFARALNGSGINVEGDPRVDYTETHQVIVNVGYANGCEIARRLEDNNIIVNYQALPGDESFTASSGLRLGVSEMTRFGMKENDFESLAPMFADVIKGKANIGKEIAKFRGNFTTMQYCFDEHAVGSYKKQLLETL